MAVGVAALGADDVLGLAWAVAPGGEDADEPEWVVVLAEGDAAAVAPGWLAALGAGVSLAVESRTPAAAAGSSKARVGCGIAADSGCGTGMGREALAGAHTDRKARSAAEIRVSSGLSDSMHSL